MDPISRDRIPTCSSRRDLTETSLVRRRWYTVDVGMIPSKVGYFFEYAKEGSHWPYLVLFYVSIGLDPAQAGLISGIRYIGGMVGGPLWGYLADKKHCYKGLAMMLCVIAALTTCMLPLITLAFADPSKNKCSHTLNSTSTEPMSDGESDGEYKNPNILFYSLLAVSILSSFFDGSTMGFTDSGVLRAILNSSGSSSIGRQRYFGPLGYAVAAFCSGLFIDYFPFPHMTCYAGIFLTYVLVCAGLCTNFYFLLDKNGGRPKQATVDTKVNVNQILWSKLKNVDNCFFLLTVLFNGMALALAFSFSFLYLKEFNASSVLLGSSTYVNGVSSGVFFLFTRKMIKVLGGTYNGMSLSCLSWGMRYIGMVYMKSPYEFLAICLLNGFNCSLFIGCYIEHIKHNFPPSVITIMCGLTYALYSSGGYLLANVIGGTMYKAYGGRRLFLGCAIACAIWSFVTMLYGYNLKCRRKLNRVGSIYNLNEESQKTISAVDLKVFYVATNSDELLYYSN